MLRLTSLLSLLVLLSACSPQKLLEKGQPEKAFERAAWQAERNENAKTQTLDALANAYTILQDSDYRQVSRLANSSSPTRWELMVDLLDCLERRRVRVEHIRLNAKRVMRVDQASEPAYAQELAVAKYEAAAHLLKESKNLIALAENGDIIAARVAFDKLEKRDRYAPRTGEVNTLSRRANYLGTIRVALDAQGPISDRDIDNIGRATERALSGRWVDVYPMSSGRASEAHLIAELDIDNPDVGFTRRDQTQDHFKRIIEERKKVGIDTSGNAIYKVVKKTIKATVFTKTIYRQSSASARITISNAATGTILKQRNFNGVYVFEDISSRIRGNQDALDGYCPPSLNSPLRSAPSGFAMEAAALKALRRAVPRIDLSLMLDEAALVAR